MSAINNKSFFITLNIYNNYTSTYTLNDLQIKQANYVTIYSNVNCLLLCDFLPFTFILDENNDLTSQRVANISGNVGVIYQVPNMVVNTGKISLYQSLTSFQDPITIFFSFSNYKPTTLDIPDSSTYLNLVLPASSKSVSFQLGNNYIKDFEYFQFYSDYDGVYDVSFCLPNQLSYGTGLNLNTRYCPTNDNRLEFFKCDKHILNGSVQTINNYTANFTINFFFIFYKNFPKHYIEKDPYNQENRLILIKPTSYQIYANPFSTDIIKYFNTYNKCDAYFYYNNCRLYISKLGIDFFDYVLNWQSINKEYVTLYFVTQTPREGKLQFFYNTQVYPGYSTMYIPFNFKTTGPIFTLNCGFTLSAAATLEQLFSIGGKVISSINMSIPAQPYSDLQPSIINYNNNTYGPKFTFDNVPLFITTANYYIYIMGGNFDQIVLYTSYNKDLTFVIGSIETNQTNYTKEAVIGYIPANSKFTINEKLCYSSIKYNNSINPNITAISLSNFYDSSLSTPIGNLPIYNILTSTAPIVGNSTIYWGYQLDNLYAQQVIKANDVLNGDVIFTLPTITPTINTSSPYKYYIISRPYYNSTMSKSQYRYTYTYTRPDKVIYLDNNSNQWTQVLVDKTDIYIDLPSDFIYFVYYSINWLYTTIPQAGYNFYYIASPGQSYLPKSNFTPSAIDNNTNLPYLLVNQFPTAGCLHINSMNNVIIKCQNFDKISNKNPSTGGISTFPTTAIGAFGTCGIGNQQVSEYWITNMLPYGYSNFNAQVVDDKPFTQGLRTFSQNFNFREYDSLFFISSSSILINLYFNTYYWIQEGNLWKYQQNFKMPGNIPKYTKYTMQFNNISNQPPNSTSFMVYSNLGIQYKSQLKPSCIINNSKMISFQNEINSLQSFNIYLSNIPDSYNTTLPYFSIYIYLQ